MHMANELLSLPVAAGSWTIAAVGLSWVCRQVQRRLDVARWTLTAMLGAFVFAGQMVNIQLPGMPGTSGHLIGTVLLTVILGPSAAALAVSSVVVVQCLIFQDGGLLALGCNILNMAMVPAFLGGWMIRRLAGPAPSPVRATAVIGLACLVTTEAAALMVGLETLLSGVLQISGGLFLGTLLAVHSLVGLLEAALTLAILGYLQQVRPDLLVTRLPGRIRWARRPVLATILLASVLLVVGASVAASELPDALEWSTTDRPDRPDFTAVVAPAGETVARIDHWQQRLAALPDYQLPVAEGPASTSLAGLIGVAVTMLILWAVAAALGRRRTAGVG